MVINIVKTIFIWTFGISLILSLLNNRDKKVKNQSSQGEIHEKTTGLEIVNFIIVVIATFASIVGGILFISFKYKNFSWLFLVVSIPLFLSYITGAYLSIGIVKNVVQSETAKPLSTREHWAIRTIACTLSYAEACNLTDKLMTILKTIENTIVSDMLFIAFYMLLVFLYIFLVCASLPVPLSVLSKLAIKLNAIVFQKKRVSEIGNFFIKKIDDTNIIDPFFAKIVEWAKNRSVLLYVIVLIFSPAILIADICWSVLQVMCSFVLEIIGYSFLLLRMIKRTIGKTMIWINNLSERRLVATSFRVALILTLVLTVVVNRYTPLLTEYEAGTATLEFIAGTILIPVVFEWIWSVKSKRKLPKKSD